MTQPHDSPHHAKVHNAMKKLCARNGTCSPDEISVEAGVPKRRVHERIKVLLKMGHATQMGRGRYGVVSGAAGHAAEPIVEKIRKGRTRPGGTDEARLIFGRNPQQRTPFIVCLDLSGSMNHDDAIGQLNRGLAAFVEDLRRDDLAAKRVQIAIVTFGAGGVRTAQEFVDAESFHPPVFTADGRTPMGEALLAAVELMREQKELYRDHAIASHPGWIFLISDGEPTDDTEGAANALRAEAAKTKDERQFNFYPVAVRIANRARLQEISPEPVKDLRDFNFTGMFLWVSNSLKFQSRSMPGQRTRFGPASSWSAS